MVENLEIAVVYVLQAVELSKIQNHENFSASSGHNSQLPRPIELKFGQLFCLANCLSQAQLEVASWSRKKC